MNQKWFYLSIILTLLLIIVLQRSCYKKPTTDKPKVTIIRDTDWVIKEKLVEKYVPEYIYTKDSVFIPASQLLDTSEIIKDYYTKRTYKDTILLDSLGFVSLIDSVYNNKIISRQPYYKYKFPIIKEQITIDNPPIRRNQLYAGLETQFLYQGGNISSAGVAFSYKTKKDVMYDLGVGYQFMGASSLYIKGGLKWKISLRKND